MDLIKARNSLRKNIVHHPPKGLELSKDPQVYRRDLLHDFMTSHSVKEMRELIEMENIYWMLKGTVDDNLYKKWLSGKTGFSQPQIKNFETLFRMALEIHKLKYGEKKVNMNVGVSYETVQEMIMRDGPDTPDK